MTKSFYLNVALTMHKLNIGKLLNIGQDQLNVALTMHKLNIGRWLNIGKY